jgi:methylmalonyl-CoA/ethylmalonyl-CoA epimerase
MAISAGTSEITCLGQVAITVKEVERALAFYRDKLGLKFLFQAGTLAFFDCGGVRLMLSRPEKTGSVQGNSILYFKVDDINHAHARLSGAGVRFEDKPHLIAPMPSHDLWMTFFRDSESNLMGLMSEVPRES